MLILHKGERGTKRMAGFMPSVGSALSAIREIAACSFQG
jgi:hypothetical protein